MTEILLSDVRRLRVEPGDALLVTVPRDCFDVLELGSIREGFEDALPGTKVLVVEEGIDVAVVSDAKLTQRLAAEAAAAARAQRQ